MTRGLRIGPQLHLRVHRFPHRDRGRRTEVVELRNLFEPRCVCRGTQGSLDYVQLTPLSARDDSSGAEDSPQRKPSLSARREHSLSTTQHAAIQRTPSLPQAIFSFDLIFRETSDAGKRSSAIGDRDGDHDLIRARGVADSNFHTIEVAADERGVFVSERNV
jgi:hypothetical protein